MATKNRRLPSNQRNFGATPPVQAQRSVFNLNQTWKGTFDAGYLVPFYVSEGLPGDTRKVRVSAIARLATPIKPVMDNLYLDFHFWWCPNRQLWTNWTKLMGEQDNPGDSIDYLVPTVLAGGSNALLGDWMGLPPQTADHVTSTYPVSALPFRMYNRVYNFHYRDQNLIQSVNQPTGDGPDTPGDYVPLKRGKRHDYFTASLPFQQKGDPVELPLGGLAAVAPDLAIPGTTNAPIFTDDVNSLLGSRIREAGAGATLQLIESQTPNQNLYWSVATGLVADLSQASAITVTSLRQAIAVQHVLERDARSGTRYPEILLSRFRVFDPQMLVLQRPEYLGGGTKMVSISVIPQTQRTDEGANATPQGNLAGVGVAMVDGIGFTRSFTEHGFIMGIVSARADLTYQQGVERMWSRRARFDFYHPELAHLSEQAVLYKEIYVTGLASDDDVWGYIGAYDDYRYAPSKITTAFRSSGATPLDFWHLSQYFANRPTLNQTFIEENPPVDRVIAVQDEPHFIMDAFITDTAARPMPVTGIPGLSRI